MNTENPSITITEAKELLKKNPSQILLLDIRSKEEYESQHIPVAKNIPEGELKQHASDEELKAKTIVTVCNYGKQRSQNAAKLLRDNGVENVVYLEGGTAAWFGTESILPAHH